METIDNLNLIENGLLHIEFELSRKVPSFFRICREAHLLLYRSMIETLKGSANLSILGRQSKNRSSKYVFGDGNWMEVHKIPIDGCKKAWRFSNPVKCIEPKREKKSESLSSNSKDFLIYFYDALAMVQTECYMLCCRNRLINSKAL